MTTLAKAPPRRKSPVEKEHAQYQMIPLPGPVSWNGFILHNLVNNPSRFYDAHERAAHAAAYWARNPRLEAQQWNRGGKRSPRIQQQVSAGESQPVAQANDEMDEPGFAPEPEE